MACSGDVLLRVDKAGTLAAPGLPGPHVSRMFPINLTPPPTPPHHGNPECEPDARLGPWQATGAAAISELDHDSAPDAGSVAGRLK